MSAAGSHTLRLSWHRPCSSRAPPCSPRRPLRSPSTSHSIRSWPRAWATAPQWPGPVQAATLPDPRSRSGAAACRFDQALLAGTTLGPIQMALPGSLAIPMPPGFLFCGGGTGGAPAAPTRAPVRIRAPGGVLSGLSFSRSVCSERDRVRLPAKRLHPCGLVLRRVHLNAGLGADRHRPGHPYAQRGAERLRVVSNGLDHREPHLALAGGALPVPWRSRQCQR